MSESLKEALEALDAMLAEQAPIRRVKIAGKEWESDDGIKWRPVEAPKPRPHGEDL